MMRKHRFLFSPDDPGGQGGGDDPVLDPNAGDPEPGDAQEGTPGPGGQDDLVPRSELSKANREAAKYRKERNELQTRLASIEESEKTEVQKAKDRATALEESLKTEKQQNRELRVQVLATRVGVVREARSDAARLLDWDAIRDPDDEAEVEEALRDLVKEKPFLLGNVPGGADAGAGGTRDSGSQDMNALLRQAAGRT
jgi:hypothetical protein